MNFIKFSFFHSGLFISPPLTHPFFPLLCLLLSSSSSSLPLKLISSEVCGTEGGAKEGDKKDEREDSETGRGEEEDEEEK